MKDLFDFTGKKVLVTGSTQGIGFAIAKAFSEKGATVYVNGAESEEKVHKATEKIKNAVAAVVDLSKKDCADRMYEITGNIDILVLNASVQVRKVWEEITDEEYDKQMDINFRSSLKLCQKYVPSMKENKWGRIVAIGSVQQRKPHKDMLVYACSKAAQMSLVENLSKQLATYGITVNNVAPGVIVTPRNKETLSDAEYAKKVMEGIPMGYAGNPDDCTGLIMTLCSDSARYITGENIYVDGGMKL
jgi:NAD(P)-dependent dehydrogenase (short-subunit alcohol dehydrogenase family)